MKPHRGYQALRRYRWSNPGFTYFLTLCTANRVTGLTRDGVAAAIRNEIAACEADGYWRVRAGVIMPEHVHLLVVLAGDLTLGRIVARLKAKTRSSLASIEGGSVRWQGNYFEHRLRPDERIEDVLRYIYLNPYRAGMVARMERYPWSWLHPEEAAWFTAQLDDERPYPEWLR